MGLYNGPMPPVDPSNPKPTELSETVYYLIELMADFPHAGTSRDLIRW